MTSFADLLNTDLVVAGRAAKAGVAWWLRELADLMPPAMRAWTTDRPSLVAARGPGGVYIVTRAGRVIMTSPRPSTRARPVVLLLPEEDVLLREVTIPTVSDSDARRLIALDLDRITPFSPDAIYHDATFVRPTAEAAARRRVSIAVIRRTALDLALEQARKAGLDPRVAAVAGHSDFDFLPAVRAAGGGNPSGRGRLYAWCAVTVLVLFNLAAFVGRDIAQVTTLRDTLDTQRGARELAIRLRRRVQDEAARRTLIAHAHGGGEPLRVLDAVTRALPDGAWVQRLSWKGGAVRIAGYRQDNIDIAAALQTSPQFHNVRNSTSDPLARLAAGQPFDVTADLNEAVTQ